MANDLLNGKVLVDAYKAMSTEQKNKLHAEVADAIQLQVMIKELLKKVEQAAFNSIPEDPIDFEKMIEEAIEQSEEQEALFAASIPNYNNLTEAQKLVAQIVLMSGKGNDDIIVYGVNMGKLKDYLNLIFTDRLVKRMNTVVVEPFTGAAKKKVTSMVLSYTAIGVVGGLAIGYLLGKRTSSSRATQGYLPQAPQAVPQYAPQAIPQHNHQAQMVAQYR